VEELFGPGGRLESALPGFEVRDEQIALARAVADALDGGEHLLAEAGTGTGKSLAYLLPALASGRRVVVASATKALQEQLLLNDVPAAAAAQQGVEMAAALVADLLPPPEVDVLAHVPGDPERAWARGSVAPRGLAVALCELWRVPAVELLRRTHSLPRQRGLGLQERRRNVRGSVLAVGAVPRSVCLVDDVYTSGATADACAAALRRAGAWHVEVITLARAVR